MLHKLFDSPELKINNDGAGSISQSLLAALACCPSVYDTLRTKPIGYLDRPSHQDGWVPYGLLPAPAHSITTATRTSGTYGYPACESQPLTQSTLAFRTEWVVSSAPPPAPQSNDQPTAHTPCTPESRSAQLPRGIDLPQTAPCNAHKVLPPVVCATTQPDTCGSRTEKPCPSESDRFLSISCNFETRQIGALIATQRSMRASMFVL
jgi:hypothetical protein